MGNACIHKAQTLVESGTPHEALPLYDRAIGIYGYLVEVQAHHELSGSLALAWKEKALAMEILGDDYHAAILYDRAVKTLEHLVKVEDYQELEEALTHAYAKRAQYSQYRRG